MWNDMEREPLPRELTEEQWHELQELRREAQADFEYEEELTREAEAAASAEEAWWANASARAQEEEGIWEELHWQGLIERAVAGEYDDAISRGFRAP